MAGTRSLREFSPSERRRQDAFNKMLSIPGASVASVEFTPEGVLVGLRRRKGRPRCPCGWKATGAYDSSVRRWRHLDLGSTKLLLQAKIRRLDCRRCERVRTEDVPWARRRHPAQIDLRLDVPESRAGVLGSCGVSARPAGARGQVRVPHTWATYSGAMDGLIRYDGWRMALDRLDHAGIPVALVAGARDPVPVAGRAEKLAGSHPNITVAVHPDGGHGLPMTDPTWCRVLISKAVDAGSASSRQ